MADELLNKVTELAQRVAVLEARLADDETEKEVRRQDVTRQLERVQHTLEKQAREMERYRGVIGGIALAISVFWAGVAFFRDAISRWLAGH